MAKSKSFFGLRRGSTKSQTFQVNKGQQITKDRVTEVANPKTTKQMHQRALFQTAVKFYKHANQRFFKFAFEDKKPTESDYNAFMRHNLQRSTIYEYNHATADGFPAIGNNWLITRGSLSAANVDVSTSRLRLLCSTIEGTETTWGAVCSLLMARYNLEPGDFITVVGVRSIAQDIEELPEDNPAWFISQFVLDPNSTMELGDVISVGNGFVSFDVNLSVDDACAGAVVFSRNIKGGSLKVSNAQLINNDVARNIYTASLNETYRQTALNSWGATGQAILQGSLVQ